MIPFRSRAVQATDDKGALYLDNKAVDGDIFIPHAFAMEKLKSATTQYIDMKMSYDQHILQLRTSHDSHCQQTQLFYEGYIKELKRKAKQHVEGQSALKQEMLDDSRQKVADSEEVVERLRDQLAYLRLTYQEDSRSLKQQLSLANENEAVLQARIYDASVRSECAAVISDLILMTECTLLRQNFEDKMDIASGKILSLSISGVKTAKAGHEEKYRIQTDIKTERECRAAMQAMLLRIEIDAHNQQIVRNNNERIAVEELRDKCQAAEMSALSLSADSVAAMTELSNLQIATDKSAAVFSAIISQHETFQSSLKNDHEVAMIALNKELKKLSVALAAADLSVQSTTAVSLDAEKLRDSLSMALVRECLSNMVADVSDRHLCQTSQVLATERANHEKDTAANDFTISGLQNQLEALKAEASGQSDRGKVIASNGVLASALVAKSEVVCAITPLDNKAVLGTALESQEAAALRLKISQVERQLLAEKQSVSLLDVQKNKSKSTITKWVAQFEVDNKRPPKDADKEMVRDKYQAYKSDTRDLKSAVAVVDGLKRELAELEVLLLHQNTNSEGNMTLSTAAPCAVTFSVDKSVDGNSISTAASVASTVKSSSRTLLSDSGSRGGEDITVIEGLEDTVYQLQQDITQSTAAASKIAEDNAILAQQLDLMTKEKRTDVVKRFEQEIVSLTAQTGHLKESLSQLEAVKARNTAKILELEDRTERAEGELKLRDVREKDNTSPESENAKLKAQIAKQREEIVLKSKAATAGWDAAASADERLDLDVERAYRRGTDESSLQHVQDMKDMNKSLESKETKITDMLVSLNAMDKRVREAEERAKIAKDQVRVARQETVETMAIFGSGGQSGEGDRGVSERELESVRDALDAAQEEVVLLSERNEKMTSTLLAFKQKCTLLEQLVAASQASNVATREKMSAALSSASNGSEITDLLANIKGALIKGTAMSKNNRKDDCFDLWVKTCDDSLPHLHSQSLRTLLIDGTQQGRYLSLGGQKKERGSVALKKTLDRLLADLQNPQIRKSEEEAASGTVQNEGRAGDDALFQGLSGQLAILEKQENASHLLLSRSSSGDDVSGRTTSDPSGTNSPRPSSQGSFSLLKRAKEAESKVELLKRQIAVLALDLQRGEDNDSSLILHQSSSSHLSASHRVKLDMLKDKERSADAVKAGMDLDKKVIHPAEMRKLVRRVKDLEGQIASGTGQSSSGNTDKMSSLVAEKAQQRMLKELESAHRKEKAVLEGRVLKAESALEASGASLPIIMAERDQLRAQVAVFRAQESEVQLLRAKGLECDVIAEQLQMKSKEFALLADQFKKENVLRKKYKNELEDLKGSIRVYARCRPMVSYEKEKGCKQVVDFVDEISVKVQTSRGEKEYEMDTVFDQQSKQEEVFEDTRRLVESFMDGFNVCLFAYGQTGSGKTFTMTGSPSEPGLTPRAVGEIFRLIEDRKHCDCKVTAYFVELYNDQLVDLLWLVDSKIKDKDKDKESRGPAQPPSLDIKLDGNKMVYVKGVVVKDASNTADLLELFTKGNAERHTGSTNMNAESSRSHSVFSIMVESYDRNTKKTVRGKLSLVDLAGSERADKTGGNADRLKEGQSINKSLSALGDVMAALSEGGKAFVPYRNNKLTQLMQDSLGGNAKTLMFVNFSPADYNADETVTSLNFATRVKKVINNASKQAESEEVGRLKATIKKLQDKLSGAKGGGGFGDMTEEGENRGGDLGGEGSLVTTSE